MGHEHFDMYVFLLVENLVLKIEFIDLEHFDMYVFCLPDNLVLKSEFITHGHFDVYDFFVRFFLADNHVL